jgi:anti-sigma factor RsiW
MENITPDVIVDLWPVYVSGKASQDTRGLVEAFLRQDPECARKLGHNTPPLPPDPKLKLRVRIKRWLAGAIWLLQFALVFTCLAFGRIVSDTSFNVSPRGFVATAVVAACFWAAFLVRLYRGTVANA